MTELFSPAEIRDLTAAKPVGRQEAWLKEKGIPFQRDGKRLIVLRTHIRAWVEGRPVVSSGGLNWSTVS